MAKARKKKTTTRKKSARAARSARGRAPREVLVVASKVKQQIKRKGMNTSAEAIGAISDRVYALLESAVARTRANGRKTVKSQDL